MKCHTPQCPNQAAPRRRRCHTCQSRNWRRAHPLRALWQSIKKRARRLDVPFQLPFCWFCRFAIETTYARHRGRRPDSLQIDRIIPQRGYVRDNVQILTARENNLKGHRERPRRRARAA